MVYTWYIQCIIFIGVPDGAAGRFWCAFESAALHAPTVAIASSHCMHKLVYSSGSSGTLARAGACLDTSLFASRRRGFGRGSRRWVRRRVPRDDLGHTGGRRNLSRRGGGGGRRGGGGGRRGVSRFSSEAAFDDLGRGTSAGTRNFEDALVERDQSGAQLCPKIIRGHGVSCKQGYSRARQ